MPCTEDKELEDVNFIQLITLQHLIVSHISMGISSLIVTLVMILMIHLGGDMHWRGLYLRLRFSKLGAGCSDVVVRPVLRSTRFSKSWVGISSKVTSRIELKRRLVEWQSRLQAQFLQSIRLL